MSTAGPLCLVNATEWHARLLCIEVVVFAGTCIVCKHRLCIVNDDSVGMKVGACVCWMWGTATWWILAGCQIWCGVCASRLHLCLNQPSVVLAAGIRRGSARDVTALCVCVCVHLTIHELPEAQLQSCLQLHDLKNGPVDGECSC